MAYHGPVAEIREEMVRERAAFALTGQMPLEPDSCPIAQKVLRARLFTAPKPWFVTDRKLRPWRLGTDMVAPEWFWKGIGRVLNDADDNGLVLVWTRKAHRAWRSHTFAARSVASAILQGEIKDAFWW